MFENSVLGRIFGHEEEVQGTGENCIMRRFIDEMGAACRMQ
jgi:hypothetical protein